jgi:hypothetical protein
MHKYLVEVSLVLNATVPLSWTVEAVNSDGDGGIDVTIAVSVKQVVARNL